MNKYKMFIAAIASIISGNAMAQSLKAGDITMAPDGTANLKIELSASQTAAAVQFDVKLPAGFRMAGTSKKGALLNDNYIVEPYSVCGDSVRIFIYDKKQGQFAKASGVLVELPVKADVGEGDYTGEISGVLVANKDASNNGTYAPSTFNISVVEQSLRGDVNGDGIADTEDLQLIIQMILGNEEKTAAADLNGDGDVTSLDIVEEVNILFPTSSAKGNGFGYAKADNNLSVKGGTTVSLSLDNTSSFSAYQFDLTLPDGLEIGDVMLSSESKGMTAFSNKIDFNTWRVVVAALDGQSVVDAHAGNIVSVGMVGNASGEATISNILFADVNAKGTAFSSKKISVKGSSITGIAGIEVDGANSGKTVYSVGGAVRKDMQRGVNIVRDANGKVTKVIKK